MSRTPSHLVRFGLRRLQALSLEIKEPVRDRTVFLKDFLNRPRISTGQPSSIQRFTRGECFENRRYIPVTRIPDVGHSSYLRPWISSQRMEMEIIDGPTGGIDDELFLICRLLQDSWLVQTYSKNYPASQLHSGALQKFVHAEASDLAQRIQQTGLLRLDHFSGPLHKKAAHDSKQ